MFFLFVSLACIVKKFFNIYECFYLDIGSTTSYMCEQLNEVFSFSHIYDIDLGLEAFE